MAKTSLSSILFFVSTEIVVREFSCNNLEIIQCFGFNLLVDIYISLKFLKLFKKCILNSSIVENLLKTK